MKTKLFKIFFSFLAFFGLLAVCAFGQNPPAPTPDSQLPEFLQWTDLVYGALVTITGYLGAFVPGINKIKDKAWRVAAIALVIAGIFLLKGWSSGLGLLFAYLSAVGFYDLIFSKFRKSPDQATEQVAPAPAEVNRAEVNRHK